MLRRLSAVIFAATIALTTIQSLGAEPEPELIARAEPGEKATKTGAFGGSKLLYTTYFYTASEAVVHGYEKDTGVRIVDLAKNRTVWKGTVGPGETKLIPTGRGVFSFLSDKKSAILVGTPSSCTVVGYFLRDQNGAHLSDAYYTQLPSSVSHSDARVIAWAWEDTKVQVTDTTTDKQVAEKTLKAGEFLELDASTLRPMSNHVLHFKASSKAISVQVYYDEGFFVPSRDGRVAGKVFNTYVGSITEGSNDLNLINYGRETTATVRDIKTGETIWKGKVPAGGAHSITLSQRYVHVESRDEITVSVAPLIHGRVQGYAEHHFAPGLEGTGIETRFITTTPNELWIFSYFEENDVQVRNLKSKEVIWKGRLGAGHVRGLTPGVGLFEVVSSQGTSVMGGASACGAEYSPAGGLFQVDETVLQMAKVIVEERKAKAAAEGRTLTEDEMNAPLSPSENARVQKKIKDTLGKSMSAEEVQQRVDSMVTY